MKKNASGCIDLTAYEAIKHADHKPDVRLSNVVRIIKQVLSLAGFEMVGRVVVKDVKTGKEFR